MTITKKRLLYSHKKKNRQKQSHRKNVRITHKQKAGGFFKSKFDPTESTKTARYNVEQTILDPSDLEKERLKLVGRATTAAGVGAVAGGLVTAAALGKLGSASASNIQFGHFLSSLFLGTKTGAGLGGSFLTAPLSLWIIGTLAMLGGPLLLKMLTTTISKEHVSNIYLTGILNELLRNASLEKFHSMYKSIEFLIGPDICSKEYWTAQKASKIKLLDGLHKQKIAPLITHSHKMEIPNINNPEENDAEDRLAYENILSYMKIKTRLKYNWADTPENLRLINLRKQAYLWDIFQQKWIPESIWRLLSLKYKDEPKMRSLYNDVVLKKAYYKSEYRIILDSEGLWRYSLAKKVPGKTNQFTSNTSDGDNEIKTDTKEYTDGLLVYKNDDKNVIKKKGQLYFCNEKYTEKEIGIQTGTKDTFNSFLKKTHPIRQILLLERHLLDFINIYGFEIGLYRKDDGHPFTISNLCKEEPYKTTDYIVTNFRGSSERKSISDMVDLTSYISEPYPHMGCDINVKQNIVIYLKRIKENTYSSTDSNTKHNYFLLINTDSSGKFEKLSIYYNNKPSERSPLEQQIVTINRTDPLSTDLKAYFKNVLLDNNNFEKDTVKMMITELWMKETNLYSSDSDDTKICLIQNRLKLVQYSEKMKGFIVEGPKIGLNFLRKYSIDNCKIKPLLLYGTANILGTLYKSQMKIKTMILYEILATELLQMFCTFRTLLRVFIEYVPVDSSIDKNRLDSFEIKDFKMEEGKPTDYQKQIFSPDYTKFVFETKKKMGVVDGNTHNTIAYLRSASEQYNSKVIVKILKEDANRLFVRRFSCRSDDGGIVNVSHKDGLTIPVHHKEDDYQSKVVFLFNGSVFQEFTLIEEPNKYDEAQFEPVWIPVHIPIFSIRTSHIITKYTQTADDTTNHGNNDGDWIAHLSDFSQNDIKDEPRKSGIGIKKITYTPNSDNSYYQIETYGEHTFVEHDRIQFVWNLFSDDEDNNRTCNTGKDYCNIFQNCKGGDLEKYFQQEIGGTQRGEVLKTNRPYHLQRMTTNSENNFRIFVHHTEHSLRELNGITEIFDCEKINMDLTHGGDTYIKKFNQSPLYAIRIKGNSKYSPTNMDSFGHEHYKYDDSDTKPSLSVDDVSKLDIFADNNQILVYGDSDIINFDALNATVERTLTKECIHDVTGAFVYGVANAIKLQFIGTVESIHLTDKQKVTIKVANTCNFTNKPTYLFSKTKLDLDNIYNRISEIKAENNEGYASTGVEEGKIMVFNSNIQKSKNYIKFMKNNAGDNISKADYKSLKIYRKNCYLIDDCTLNSNKKNVYVGIQLDSNKGHIDAFNIKRLNEIDDDNGTVKVDYNPPRNAYDDIDDTEGKTSLLVGVPDAKEYGCKHGILPAFKASPFQPASDTIGGVGTYTLILPELSLVDYDEYGNNQILQFVNKHNQHRIQRRFDSGYNVGFLVQEINDTSFRKENVLNSVIKDGNKLQIVGHTYKTGDSVFVSGPDNHKLFKSKIKNNHLYFVSKLDADMFTLHSIKNDAAVEITSDEQDTSAIHFLPPSTVRGHYYHAELDVNNIPKYSYLEYIEKIKTTFNTYSNAYSNTNKPKTIGGAWYNIFGTKTKEDIAKDVTPQSLQNVGVTKGNLKHNVGKVLQSSAIASVALELPLLGWIMNMNRKKYYRQITLDKWQVNNIRNILCTGHLIKPNTLLSGFDESIEYEKTDGNIVFEDERELLPKISTDGVIIILRNFDIQSLARVKMSFKVRKDKKAVTDYIKDIENKWSGKTRWRYDISLRNNTKEKAPELMEDFPLAFNPCLTGMGNAREKSVAEKGVETGTFQKKEAGGKGLFSKKTEKIENVEVGRGIGHGTMKTQDALATITSKFISFFGQDQQDDVKESVMNLITKYSSNLLMIGPGIFKKIEELCLVDAVKKLYDNGLTPDNFSAPFAVIANHKVAKMMKTLKKISIDFESHTAKNRLIYANQVLDLSNDLPKQFLEIKRLYSIISSIEKSNEATKIKRGIKEEQENRFNTNINVNVSRGGKKKQKKSRKNRNQKRKSRKN